MKKQGFTMVELLAVIVILGILGTIAVPVITSIVDRVRNQYYYTMEGNVEIAGRDYFTQYRSLRPQAVAYTSKVDIATLMDEKFIEDVIESKSGKRCDGFVIAIREEDNKMDYHACITCGTEYQSKSEFCGSAYDPDNNDSIYTVEAPKPYQSYLNEKLTLKKGKVYQRGKLYKSDLLPKDTSTVDTTKEGSYPLVYTYENAKDETKVTIYELKPPAVTLYEVNDSGTTLGKYDGEWTNKNIRQNFNSQYATSYQYALSSNATSWTTLANNSILKTNMNQRRYVRSKDDEGHVSKTSYYDVKIDKIKPTVKYTTGTRYDNQDLDVKITVSDSGTFSSGVKNFKYCKTTASICTPTITQNRSSATIKLTTHSSTNKICVVGYDNAGNQSSVICSGNYKIDKTPTCPSIKASVAKETWTNQTVELTVTPTSDTKNWTWYTNTNGGAYTKFSTVTGQKKVTFSGEGVRQGKIVVTNNEGISKTCYTDKYYIDKTAPSCPYISASVSKETWTNQTVRLSITPTSDTKNWTWYTNTNGGAYTQFSTSVGKKVVEFSGEGKRQGKILVTDEAGNSKTCYTDQYYIDKTKPTITVTSNLSWSNAASRNVTIQASDKGGSNVLDTRAWSGSWYGNIPTTPFVNTFSATSHISGVSVRDRAGNVYSTYVLTNLDRLKPYAPYINISEYTSQKNSIISITCSSNAKNNTGNNECTIRAKCSSITEYPTINYDQPGNDKNGSSGVASTQIRWIHGGTAKQYPNWTDVSDVEGTLRTGVCTTAQYYIRSVDAAGNVGPYIHFVYIQES